MSRWIRLLLAIVATAFLSVAFNLAEGGSFPKGEQWATIGLGFLLLIIVYGLVVTVLYFLALAASKLGVAAWMVFAGLFFGMSASWFYFALSRYDKLEIAGQAIVTMHKLTPAGWSYWERGVTESAVMAGVAALILYGLKTATIFARSGHSASDNSH